MKFSVLMSIYKNDDPSFLNEALESIYDKQSLKPDEIVIVFDGPLTLELYKTVDKFKKDKNDIVKTIPIENNCGLGEALRIGTDYCTHEYIFRMDSDDISDENRFSKQISYLKEHPEIDVLGGNILEFNRSINDMERLRIAPKTNDEIKKMAKRRNPMNHVTVAIKKSSLIKCGGYKNLLLLEDYYLWLNMIVCGCILENLDDSLVYVRVGNGFVNKRGSRERISGWRIIQDYMLKNNLINPIDAWLNMIYIRVFVYMPPSIREIIYKKILRKGV